MRSSTGTKVSVSKIDADFMLSSLESHAESIDSLKESTTRSEEKIDALGENLREVKGGIDELQKVIYKSNGSSLLSRIDRLEGANLHAEKATEKANVWKRWFISTVLTLVGLWIAYLSIQFVSHPEAQATHSVSHE